MISFQNIENILFSEDGFDKNRVVTTDQKYWLAKTDSFIADKYHQKEWELNFENDVFSQINNDSDFSLLFGLITEKNLIDVFQNTRVDYYRKIIRSEAFAIMQNISNAYRGRLTVDSSSVLSSIRWYVFECIKINKKYTSAFYELINDDEAEVEDLSIDVSNFGVNNYLIECLISLYRQIQMIQYPIKYEATEDSFFNHVLEYKYSPASIYHIFKERINKFIEVEMTDKKRLPYHLKNLLSVIKKVGYNTIKRGDFFDIAEIKNDIIELEDLLLKKFLHGLIETPEVIDEVKKMDGDDFFNAIYREIKTELSKITLPNERIFELETKIEMIREILDDEFANVFDSLMSHPRILMNKLQIDLTTIKANPTIDLIEFDRNRIKPIKLDLSVPQLALMFRLLLENKLIDAKEKTELYNTISKAFATKASSSISQSSLKNKFNAPEIKDYEFWRAKFLELSRNSFSI